MALAMVLVFIYINLMRFSWRLPIRTVLGLLGTGAIIALHWVTFFKAIKVSNVSIALACMSVGALFAAFLEPLWYKRKLVGYEVLFGLMVVFGLGIIFKVETHYWLLTVLLFLTTELGLAALVFLTELVLIVLPFFTELVLTELKNSFTRQDG